MFVFAFAQGWSQRAAVRTLTPERERELELQMQMPSPKGRQSPAKPKAPDTAQPGAATEQPGGRALLLRGVTLWTTLMTFVSIGVVLWAASLGYDLQDSDLALGGAVAGLTLLSFVLFAVAVAKG